MKILFICYLIAMASTIILVEGKAFIGLIVGFTLTYIFSALFIYLEKEKNEN